MDTVRVPACPFLELVSMGSACWVVEEPVADRSRPEDGL